MSFNLYPSKSKSFGNESRFPLHITHPVHFKHWLISNDSLLDNLEISLKNYGCCNIFDRRTYPYVSGFIGLSINRIALLLWPFIVVFGPERLDRDRGYWGCCYLISYFLKASFRIWSESFELISCKEAALEIQISLCGSFCLLVTKVKFILPCEQRNVKGRGITIKRNVMSDTSSLRNVDWTDITCERNVWRTDITS